ncbi:MAG TPA: TIGR00645 family protein, partial [Ramlibacter sp.]|nr:TIGR00645 family protein [Ramlibacter sp.]
QTVIHIAFLLSAMAIAYTDKLMSGMAQTTSKH